LKTALFVRYTKENDELFAENKIFASGEHSRTEVKFKLVVAKQPFIDGDRLKDKMLNCCIVS
jgi:hypothetical protein